MSGNVYEWCQDHYDDEYYRVGIGVNPTGSDGGQERTIRGGSYSGDSGGTAHDTIGFRVAMGAEWVSLEVERVSVGEVVEEEDAVELVEG